MMSLGYVAVGVLLGAGVQSGSAQQAAAQARTPAAGRGAPSFLQTAPVANKPAEEPNVVLQARAFQAAPQKGEQMGGAKDGAAAVRLTSQPDAVFVVKPGAGTCYTVRSYNFTRETAPGSTRLAGMTTCQSSRQTQRKDAAEPVSPAAR